MEAQEYKATSSTVLKGLEAKNSQKGQDLQQVREEHSYTRFMDLRRGDKLKVAKKIGVRSEIISKIADEARILSLFPELEKSKSAALARIKTYGEMELFYKKYDVYGLQVKELYNKVQNRRRK